MTQEQAMNIEQAQHRDFVDTSIMDLVRKLDPIQPSPMLWNTYMIGGIRELIEHWLVDPWYARKPVV